MDFKVTIRWPKLALLLEILGLLCLSTSLLSVYGRPDNIGMTTETGCPHNYTQILDGLLEGYDKRLRPNYGGPAVDVQVGLYVENIFSVDESSMEVSMTLFVRQVWKDPRLAFEGDGELVLKGDDIELFWSPDLFFLYEIRAWTHEVTMYNKALYVYSDGTMFKSQRLSVITGCQMELHKFPLDDQKCSIQMMSYAYTSNHLNLTITPENVELDPEIAIPSFHLNKYEILKTQKQYALGYYSCAGITFHFHRYWQAYMLTVYLPSYLLVIISWLSFFIDSKSAPARVSLGVTTVLTMTTLTTSVLNSLPQVTYTKSIDIWLAACLVFIFSALVEYAIASQLNCHEDHKQYKKQEKWRHSLFELQSGYHNTKFIPDESSDSDTKGDIEGTMSRDATKDHDLLPLWLMPAIREGLSKRCTARYLDYHAKWIYFVSFVIFNVVYWTVNS